VCDRQQVQGKRQCRFHAATIRVPRAPPPIEKTFGSLPKNQCCHYHRFADLPRRFKNKNPAGYFIQRVVCHGSPKLITSDDAIPGGGHIGMKDKPQLARDKRRQAAGSKPPGAAVPVGNYTVARVAGNKMLAAADNKQVRRRNNLHRLARDHPSRRQPDQPRPRRSELYRRWPIHGRLRGRFAGSRRRAREPRFQSESSFS